MRETFPRQGTELARTAADATALGERLGAAVEAGDVVVLDGPLGAGKTTFTQGIARGMQVKGRVTSPTFIIAREHRSTVGGPALVHVDAYRLLDGLDTGEGAASGDPLGELDALDLDTDLEEAVVVVEWGEGLAERLSTGYLAVRIDREAADETRAFAWHWHGG